MNSDQAQSELKAFQDTRKGAGDYYSQFQNELGVGDAQTRQNDIRSQIRSTESALKGVNDSVAGRTRGNLVTEAQRARLVGLERAPIADELGGLQGSFADAQSNYRDLLGQATTRAGQSYQTDADKLASLQGNYDRIYQREQADAEARRWQQQQAEAARQWQAQFDESQRQFAASQANTRNQMAQQASLYQKQLDTNNADAERQRAIEEEARHTAQGAASAANNPYKKVGLWDAFWQPMGNTFSNVGKFFGF